MPISLVVHGGAGNFPSSDQEIARQGCQEAALVGWNVLQTGGSALDAVETAVRALEDNPVYNAGTGSYPNREGKIELDAGIMDGRTLNLGAVIGVELIKNPILLAHKVLASPHVLLAGRGAEQFASENGIARCAFDDLLTGRRYKRWQEDNPPLPEDPSSDESNTIYRELGPLTAYEDDKHGTVGAVALDSSGGLAAATSTGGISNKYPGRVGDSPLVGCGFYADELAAVSCTGQGEDFVRLLIAKRAADFVAQGCDASEAAKAAIAFLRSKATGTGGLILLDHVGNIGFAWNSEHMAYAYISTGMDVPITGI